VLNEAFNSVYIYDSEVSPVRARVSHQMIINACCTLGWRLNPLMQESREFQTDSEVSLLGSFDRGLLCRSPIGFG
jgi:hypothetical protein